MKMKNKVILILIELCLGAAIGCSNKTIDSVSYIRECYETTFVSLSQPMVIPSNLLLIQNIIKETESEGIYSCNWRGYSASLQGKWVLSNDTLTLYPELYVEISDERGEFKYWPINKEKKSLDSEVCKFKVRNDTLYDITDYTEFHRFTSKEFGIGADYKYNPDEKIPCYIMLHYKPFKYMTKI